MLLKTFAISGSVFDGWRCQLDIEDISNKSEIIAKVKQLLKEWLIDIKNLTNQFDLYGLKQSLSSLQLHIHDLTIEDIQKAECVYLCFCHDP